MTVVLIAGHLWRTKFPGRINTYTILKFEDQNLIRLKARLVKGSDTVSGSYPVNFWHTHYRIISKPVAVSCPGLAQCKQPQSRMQPEAQNPCSKVLLDTDLAGPLLVPLWTPASHRATHTDRGCQERPSFLAPSTQRGKALGRDAGQQGKGCFPLQGDICLFHTFTRASLQHLLCKRTARSGGRCEK